MNFAEGLVYWYLRLNGFFPITNFVLHQNEEHRTSDADIVAVRFPHVSEPIGGQPEDWDRRFAEEWHIGLAAGTVGLVVEVKSGRWSADDLSAPSWRVRSGLQRMGMLPPGAEFDEALMALQTQSVTRAGGHTFAKLFVGNGPKPLRVPWLHLSLDEADEFVRARIRRYHERKHGDRLFFSGELIQYLAWKGHPLAE